MDLHTLSHSLPHIPYSSFPAPTPSPTLFSFFFFNDTAPTEIYTLSLHDALPIYRQRLAHGRPPSFRQGQSREFAPQAVDRKSTRLNSSHVSISYAVFCLKKKKQQKISNLMIKKTHHIEYASIASHVR